MSNGPRTARWKSLAAFILVLGGAAGLPGCGGGGGSGASAPPSAQAGAAPNFTVTTAGGQTIHLSDYRGHVVLLDFWASWCEFCVEEMPNTQSLAQTYASQGVVTIGVDSSESQSAFSQFVQANPQYNAITFAYDPSQSLGGVYHISGIPTQLVIDKNGNIAGTFVGYSADDSAVASAINQALSE